MITFIILAIILVLLYFGMDITIYNNPNSIVLYCAKQTADIGNLWKRNHNESVKRCLTWATWKSIASGWILLR